MIYTGNFVFTVSPNTWIFMCYGISTKTIKANTLKYVVVGTPLPALLLSQADCVLSNSLTHSPVLPVHLQL